MSPRRRSPLCCRRAPALLLAGMLAASLAAQAADERTRAWLEQVAAPGDHLAAVRELVDLDAAALPVLHRALRDARPQVVEWALFACRGLRGDVESLREPVRMLMASKQLGIALAARRAWPALDGHGRTLVADYQADRVIAFDAKDSTVLVEGRGSLMSVQALPDAHLLLVAYATNCVLEMDGKGEVIWTRDNLSNPMAAERLPNGNTLIADALALRVIEVDAAGEVVWTFADGVRPIDVQRLGNGNTLIGSYDASGVVEVDPQGKVVWQFACHNARGVERLPDGSTLVALAAEQRVVRVARDLTVLREWKFGFAVNDAELQPDGHLVAAGEEHVVEVDADGNEVWNEKVRFAGRVLRLGRALPRKK